MDAPKTGFSFDLCWRNEMMTKKGLKSPKYLNIRTTIADLIFEVYMNSQLKLHRCHTCRESRVITALIVLKSQLFRYHGHVSVALVLGGADVTGPHLHAGIDTLPFATIGSRFVARVAIIGLSTSV
ncbi:putative proteasome endopeptidase complex [Helianthus anomalus]